MRIFLVLAQIFCLVGVLEGADVSTCLKAASCSWIHCWRVGEGMGIGIGTCFKRCNIARKNV